MNGHTTGYYPAALEVSLGTVADNFAIVRKTLGPRRAIIATIKANAYGHGVLGIARALREAGADYLAVDAPSDARAIRAADIHVPILILSELPPALAAEVAREGFIPTVASREAVEAVASSEPQVKPVFIKVDCGFGRFGIPLAEAREFVTCARSQTSIEVRGVYTHLPFSDAEGQNWAESQKYHFETLIAELEAHGGKIPVTQSMSSPGFVTGSRDGLNAVAVGHLLYGLCPVKPDMAKQYESFGFRRALVAIRTSLVRSGPAAQIGEAAPYLRNGVTRTGVVPIGLAQGYHPPVSGRNATMLLGNTHVRVLRVCLSSTILDLSAMPEAEAGMDVHVLRELGSSKISLDDIVAWQHSSALSVLTGLGLGCHHQFV